MRVVAIGMIVLAVLILGFTALSVVGYFMVEEDDPSNLVLRAAVSGFALLILWGGIRLLGRQT